MIAIVHSIYSQSVHAPALNAGLMDNDDKRYCSCKFMQLAIICRYICVHVFLLIYPQIFSILLKIDIQVRYSMMHV